MCAACELVTLNLKKTFRCFISGSYYQVNKTHYSQQHMGKKPLYHYLNKLQHAACWTIIVPSTATGFPATQINEK